MHWNGLGKTGGVIAFLAALVAEVSLAYAGAPELTGRADFEINLFPSAPQHSGQDQLRFQPSMVLSPELYMDWNDGSDTLALAPILRLDAVDQKRTHADIRELAWKHYGEAWTLTAGIDTVFWGATESRHLVDIINQTDLVEDPSGEEKLGQPMIGLGYQLEEGEVSLYWLPIFRQRTFSGEDGRFRAAAVVDPNRATFTDGRDITDFALRHGTTLGAWDLGLSYFRGTSREPRGVLALNAQRQAIIVPTYDRIDQIGLDLQGAVGDWLWKMEAAHRRGHGKNFQALVGGFEHTTYNVLGDDRDLGLIAEYLYDGRGTGAPATAYDNDVFLGARISFNDVDDTSLLGGAMFDVNNGGASLRLEYRTRLSEFMSLDIEGKAFNNISSTDPLAAYRDDHSFLVRITRYF